MATKNTVRLQCIQCKEINYFTKKNLKKNPTKLSSHKFCASCRSATTHKEIKRK